MLSVVIPTTDVPPTLDRCLAALARSDERHAVDVEVNPDAQRYPRPSIEDTELGMRLLAAGR